MENTKTDLVNLITKVGNEFIDAVDKFSDEEINMVPFPGSWTPAQVADHIIKATGDIPDRFTEKADRQYDQKVGEMENVFLDFNAKYKSPDFVQPAGGPFKKEELIKSLQAILEKHKSKIPQVDLSAVCLRFELPAIGTMTRYEWYRFFVAHTKRHLFQLNNMLNYRAFA
ncbi:MAG: DinB family protein [Chitinophagaceae bacterium]|nr:DinB family protein [Chitinophagaceae bacterium]